MLLYLTLAFYAKLTAIEPDNNPSNQEKGKRKHAIKLRSAEHTLGMLSGVHEVRKQ